jgi:lambda family phage tail tape measure protein
MTFIIKIKGDAAGFDSVINKVGLALDGVEKKAGKAGDSIKRWGRESSSSAQQASNAFSTLQGQLDSLTSSVNRFAAAFGISFGVTKVLELADAYTSLGNRIAQVSSSTSEQIALMQRTRQIADDARASWSATGETFVRLTNATKDMGLGQERVLDLTGTISKAFAMSGASATEASAGMLQLTQALASGKLQGDEFRSIAESIPSVLDLVAKQMGVSRGALKDLASEGKITSDVIVSSFERAQASIEFGFAKAAPTISQQWTTLRNEFTEMFGKFAEESKVLDILAGAFRRITDVLEPMLVRIGGLIGKVQQLGDREIGGVKLSMGGAEAFEEAFGVSIASAGGDLFTVGGDRSGKTFHDVLTDIHNINDELKTMGDRFSGLRAGTPWDEQAKDLSTMSKWLGDINEQLATLSNRFDDLKQQRAAVGLTNWIVGTMGSGITGLEKFGDDLNELVKTKKKKGPSPLYTFGAEGMTTRTIVEDQLGGSRADRGIFDVDIGEATERAMEPYERMTEAQKLLTDQWKRTIAMNIAEMDPWSRAFESVLRQATDVAGAIESVFTNAYSGIEDSIVSLVTTCEASFSRLINSMLADMTRLTTRQLFSELLQLFGGGWGQSSVFGTGARQGFSGRYGSIPGFAEGGSYRAPLTGGGPDSLLFAARVSPGERIDFTPDGASSGASSRGKQPITVVLSDSRSEAELEDFVIRVIRRNAPAIRGPVTGR